MKRCVGNVGDISCLTWYGETHTTIFNSNAGDTSAGSSTAFLCYLLEVCESIQGTNSGTGINGHPNQAFKFLAAALEITNGARAYMEGMLLECSVPLMPHHCH